MLFKREYDVCIETFVRFNNKLYMKKNLKKQHHARDADASWAQV